MEWIIAFLPMFLFGFNGVFLMKTGADPRQQAMGQMFAALLVAIFLALFSGLDTNPSHMLAAFVVGFVLGLGISTQIQSFHYLGVSGAMPLSTGGQLLGVSLVGIFVFQEWVGTPALPVGIVGLILILTGVLLAAWTEPKEPETTTNLGNVMPAEGSVTSRETTTHDSTWRTGMILTAISVLLLIGFPTLSTLWSVNPLQTMLPQAVGLVLAGFVATFPVFTKGFGPHDTRWDVKTLLCIAPGMLWGLGLVAMQYSLLTIGVAIGFALTQLTVIISTFAGIWILKEKKTPKEMKAITVGVLLLAIGAVLLGVAKSLDVPV